MNIKNILYNLVLEYYNSFLFNFFIIFVTRVANAIPCLMLPMVIQLNIPEKWRIFGSQVREDKVIILTKKLGAKIWTLDL